MKERILIVEDDKDIARLIQYNLDKSGFACDIAPSGEEAIASLSRRMVDLVLLDVMLPGVDGFEVCRRIKRDEYLRKVLVMMITAKGEEVDRIVGLELGAEDYIVKPFSPRELVLRVKAVLRRKSMGSDKDVLKFGSLCLDKAKFKVTVGEHAVVLTSMEFKLLACLMERQGRVQGREQLLTDVWGIEAEVFTRTVDTHVRRLRHKLGDAGEFIETVVGVGYRFKCDDAQ